MKKKIYKEPAIKVHEIKEPICFGVESHGQSNDGGAAKATGFQFMDSEDEGDGMLKVLNMDE